MQQFMEQLKQEKSIILAFVSFCCHMMTFICTLQFGTLLYRQTYATDKESKNFVANRLTIIFIVGSLIVLIPLILFSIYIDRLKVWKVVFTIHALYLTFLIIFVCKVPAEDHILTMDNPEPFGMTIGFSVLFIAG